MSSPEQFAPLLKASRTELMRVFSRAQPVRPDAIADYRYRGISLGLPGWVERLTWKKFAKSFARHADGSIRGWNERIVQDGLDAPWRTQLRGGEPWHFGWFGVVPCAGSDDCEIDYSVGTHGLSPLRRLRDPLRSLDEDSHTLLGYSLVDIGLGKRLSTPSWFALYRDSKLATS